MGLLPSHVIQAPYPNFPAGFNGDSDDLPGREEELSSNKVLECAG
jgi:hypothetical protein